LDGCARTEAGVTSAVRGGFVVKEVVEVGRVSRGPGGEGDGGDGWARDLDGKRFSAEGGHGVSAFLRTADH